MRSPVVLLAFTSFLLIVISASLAKRERNRLESRIEALERALVDGQQQTMRATQQAKAARQDVDDMRGNLQTTGTRTECLRQTIDTMIGVWPGRASAPAVCGAWPAWRAFGEHTDFVRPIRRRKTP
jgi:septal ring factor EnvC (AmiA/AmiB activator)